MPINWIFSDPIFFVTWILAILVTLTIHEFSHAAAARFFGDSTAEQAGRMTLNPLAHLDPLGFLMLVFVGFGWAKPVPVNLGNTKNPRLAEGVISLAGPFSNFLGIFIFGIILKFVAPALGPYNLLTNFLFLLVLVNTILMVFNLIPIPPLDGSKVLFSLLPSRFDEFKYKFSINGPWILLVLVILDSFLPRSILGSFFNLILNFLARFL
ncbi:MAG: site-2 protease family protein [Patescibacteria group bacterium]